jgi:hypothetical protein
LVFDGSPLLPSGVTAHGRDLVTGADARHLAEVRPDAYEPAPKARVDEERVLLGGHEVEVCDLVAAVLRRVRTEAERVAPLPPGATVLTVPAAWASHRRARLLEAASRAGLPDVELLPEPVAAARCFLPRLPALARDGATALVYDLGAGTFDASVLRRRGTDFEVLHTTGLPDAGGADIDETLVSFLATMWGGQHPDAWARLSEPRTAADRRDRRRLWESTRMAKEMLSRLPAALISLPGTTAEVTLDRATLDRLAGPLVRRTVRSSRAAVTAAGVPAGDVDAVLLVGGASRMPLVSTLLAEEFGRPPVAVDQPELVVALGSLTARGARILPAPAPSPVTPVAQLSPSTVDPKPTRTRRTAWTAGLAAALLLVAATVGLTLRANRTDTPDRTTWSAATATPGSTEMRPEMKAFIGLWAQEATCRPVGFEGPFDVPAAIRSELVDRYRCDVDTGPLQGATLYFGYFAARSALGAWQTHHGVRAGAYNAEIGRGTYNAIMWLGAWDGRCAGWLQAPTASVTKYMLQTEWRKYEPANEVSTGTC